LTLGPADEVGQFTFGITCQSIDSNRGSTTAEAKLTVAEPTAILSASATTVTQGQKLTLTWSSTGTSQCTASGGGRKRFASVKNLGLVGRSYTSHDDGQQVHLIQGLAAAAVTAVVVPAAAAVAPPVASYSPDSVRQRTRPPQTCSAREALRSCASSALGFVRSGCYVSVG
jgi:hypothetical protein